MATLVYTLLKTSPKLNIQLFYHAEVPFLSIKRYRNMSTKKAFTQIFIAALLKVIQMQKKTNIHPKENK